MDFERAGAGRLTRSVKTGAAAITGPTVDLTVEFSLTGGASWDPATLVATSEGTIIGNIIEGQTPSDVIYRVCTSAEPGPRYKASGRELRCIARSPPS